MRYSPPFRCICAWLPGCFSLKQAQRVHSTPGAEKKAKRCRQPPALPANHFTTLGETFDRHCLMMLHLLAYISIIDRGSGASAKRNSEETAVRTYMTGSFGLRKVCGVYKIVCSFLSVSQALFAYGIVRGNICLYYFLWVICLLGYEIVKMNTFVYSFLCGMIM